MDTPSELNTGKVLGLTLAFDYLMKNGYTDAGEDLALRIEMADSVIVRWDNIEMITVIEDPFTHDESKLTDKAFS